MTTEVKKAIRTVDAWTADQTAMEALYGAGGYYTTLTAWEAAQQANLVAADEIRVAECYNDWSGDGLNDRLVIAGWTTDSTRYPHIRAAPGQGHGGITGAGFRFWAYDEATLTIIQHYARVSDVEIRTTEDGNGYNYAVNIADASGVVLERVIGRASHTVFICNGPGNTIPNILISCLALKIGTVKSPTGFYGQATGYDYTIFYNCIAGPGLLAGFALSNSAGIREQVLINCIGYGSATNFSGSVADASTNNAASSGTPPGSNPYGSAVGSGDFVNAAGLDFHLAPGSGLIGAGANQYSAFTTDIDGDTWPSSGAWNIGFDYHPAGASLPTLSAPTFVPGSLASNGWRPRFTATY